MITGTDHLVLAVANLEEGIATWSANLSQLPTHTVRGGGNGVDQAFFTLADDTFVELIAPADESSALAEALAKRGEGLHVLALRVDDLARTVEELKAAGRRLIGEGSHPMFIHPESASGVLVQLWPEDRPHRWRDE